MSSYEIYPDGRVYNATHRRFLKPSKSGDGYLTVALYEGGVRTTHKVHRLVAEACIPNPDNKPQVNHIDGNKHNNDWENLEWCTGSENMQHACKMGLQATGSKNYNSKLREEDVRCIREYLNLGYSVKDIAQMYGVSSHNIYAIKGGYSWRHLD